MYNLSVSPVTRLTTFSNTNNGRFNVRLTGDNPRTDLTTSGNIFVHEFNPRDYTTRHTDTEKILSSGGYTSQYFVQSKEFVLSLTVYGTRAYIENFRRLFPMGKEIALMWWDTPDGSATMEANTITDAPFPKYIFCKTQGITSPDTPEMHPLDTGDSCAVLNIRLRATDPFIHDTDLSGNATGGGQSRLDQTDKTRTATVGSNICHTADFLWFTWKNPERNTEITHTITNTTTDTSASLVFNIPANNNVLYVYYAWSDYGRRTTGYLSPSENLSSWTINEVVDLSYWDGQFIELVPGDNNLVYSVTPDGPDTTNNEGVVTSTRWGTMYVGLSNLYL